MLAHEQVASVDPFSEAEGVAVSSPDEPPPPNPTATPPTAPGPKTAANRKWWIVGGAVVIAAIVVVIIILIATSGDDGSSPVATGPAVEALQKDLTTLGYYKGPINGNYDAATQEAVKKLQTANGLPADGRLTPQTIAAIQKTLGPASQTIKAFQTTLSELGWYTGPIDGVYGPVTAQAVAGLQAQLGVTQDGILGPETFTAFQSQCQPNPSACKRPATPATTVPATTATQAPTVAPTSASPTTAASSTTTSQATSTTTTTTTASTTTSTG
jgi:peptidoglycan hydrolase-like protein with peptidoglycan-binding domain